MKTLYSISLKDSTGVMHVYGIVADTRTAAESKACELAGVPDGTEPSTSAAQHPVHAVV